jgi:hypothetical protein
MIPNYTEKKDAVLVFGSAVFQFNGRHILNSDEGEVNCACCWNENISRIKAAAASETQR